MKPHSEALSYHTRLHTNTFTCQPPGSECQAARMTVLQRSSVMATEVLLAGAVLLAGRQSRCPSAPALLLVLILGSCGLIIVDHIHFQYNGMLMGIFLFSSVLMSRGRCHCRENCHSFL